MNLASMVGHLNSKYSPEIRSAFAGSKTVEDVTALMQSFTEAVEEGKEKERGWPSAAYAVSKSGIVGMTRAIALEERKKNSGINVNSCCPGYVNTDMTKHNGFVLPWPIMPLFKPIGSAETLSRDSRAPPEGTVLT